jgi:hypothetical protein
MNLSFGFFHSKIGDFSVKFRRFALENSHLIIPFEQILRTLPRDLTYFRSDKTQNSGYETHLTRFFDEPFRFASCFERGLIFVTHVETLYCLRYHP